MKNNSNKGIPFHIKGSKVQYKRHRGTTFILETVYHPCDLKDSDYVNKEALFENIRQVARKTLREEVACNIPKYFSEAHLIYIYSDMNHRVVAVSVSGSMFEEGDFVMIMWLTMCLDEYRKNGLLRALIPKMFLDYRKEYNRVMGYTGIKSLIPFFTRDYIFGRAINPIVYHAVFVSPMDISPPIDKKGNIDISNISKKEISIRKSYLRKLGYTEDKINENLFVFQSVLTDDEENKMTHATMPLCPEGNVNKFFKDNLGLDKGNALLILIHCRPLPAMIIQFPKVFFKNIWRTVRDGVKHGLKFFGRTASLPVIHK